MLSRRKPPRRLPQGLSYLAQHLGKRGHQGLASRHEAQSHTHPGDEPPLAPVGFPEPAAGPIPQDAPAEAPPRGEGHRPSTRRTHPQEHERAALDPGSLTKQPLEFPGLAQPLPPYQPGAARVSHSRSRPSVDAAPWRGDASAPYGLPASPCAHGSHASCSAAAGWAGKCVSPGLLLEDDGHSLAIVLVAPPASQAPGSARLEPRPRCAVLPILVRRANVGRSAGVGPACAGVALHATASTAPTGTAETAPGQPLRRTRVIHRGG